MTVSVSTNTCPLALLNPPADPAGKFGRTKGNKYVNLVESTTPATFTEIL